jgi:ferrous iron transport protein A
MKKLTELKNNAEGVISSIDGGTGVKDKLEGLGIRKGIKIRKLSSQLFRGPVIIMINGRQVALGNGLARKIMVE